MGLMDWRLLVKVVVDGQDVSARFRPLLTSVELTDGVGLESDTVEISLALGSGAPRMPFPRPGAAIDIYLGAGLSASLMGRYVADEFEASGPPNVMRITGKAAVYDGGGGKTGLQDAKSRSWDAGRSLGDLVDQIAGEHGLAAAVGGSMRSLILPHIDQIDESDINLLTRIATELGGFVKPAGSQLVVARRGESQAASGAAMPLVTLTGPDLTRWSVRREARPVAGSCVAIWRDVDAARDREVRVGQGKPDQRLRHRYSSEADARRAAEAALAKSARGALRISCQAPGRADVVAEGKVVLPPLQPDLAGTWLVTSVSHSVSKTGWSMAFEAELP